MTIKELKESKQLPQIEDSELLKIVNEILGEQSQVSDLEYSLEDGMVDKIKYSPAMLDLYIEQVMSSPNMDRSYLYGIILEELKKKEDDLSNKEGFEEEKQYLQTKQKEIQAKKINLDTFNQVYKKNEDLINSSNLSENSIKHFNKDALAMMMTVMLGQIDGLQQMLPMIEELSKKVDEMYKIAQQQTQTQSNVQSQILETPNSGMESGPASFTEEIERAPEPKIISEEPRIIPNSLQDLINRNIISKGINSESLIKYCNEVLNFNPPIVNLDYVMKPKELEQLKSSVFYQNIQLQGEIKSEHKVVVDRYANLIGNYQSMLNRMQGNPQMEKEAQEIRSLINKLEKARDSYNLALEGLDGQNIDAYFDFAVYNNQGFAEFASERAKEKTTAQEEKAVELDSEIANLTNQRDRLETVKATGLVTKLKRDFDLNKLNKKIERLRKKQGKIKSNQRKIINSNTEKYKKRMEREFEKFQRQQEKIDLATQMKLNKVDNLNAKEEKLENISKKFTSLEEKRKQAGLLGKMKIDAQKATLKNKQERIKAAKKRLETKIGKIDLSKQYQTSYNKNFAYAM